MDYHFNEIAEKYDNEIPRHIRNHLLGKKTTLMVKILNNKSNMKKGLEIGCGTGWYSKIMADYGFDMTAVDSSKKMIEMARTNNEGNNVLIKEDNICELSFKSQSFDFAYIINVLHHVDKKNRIKAIYEVLRVLKPNGIFFIHDVNCDNLIFRFYMDFIFPFTSNIDDDHKEDWVSIRWFNDLKMEVVQIKDIKYFTFLPNFLPQFIFRLFKPVEELLETYTRGKVGAHYMVTLKNVYNDKLKNNNSQQNCSIK